VGILSIWGLWLHLWGIGALNSSQPRPLAEMSPPSLNPTGLFFPRWENLHYLHYLTKRDCPWVKSIYSGSLWLELPVAVEWSRKV
jgi:hypothetical protein